MTDPVNTDALRKLSRQLYGMSMNAKSELTAAAADELEQLRKDKETLLTTVRKAANAYVERAAMQDSAAHVATVTVNWSVVAVEVMEQRDQLRAALENAPHDSRCTIHPEPGYTPNCTCWKAKL
jgi:hypothetical protein